MFQGLQGQWHGQRGREPGGCSPPLLSVSWGSGPFEGNWVKEGNKNLVMRKNVDTETYWQKFYSNQKPKRIGEIKPVFFSFF